MIIERTSFPNSLCMYQTSEILPTKHNNKHTQCIVNLRPREHDRNPMPLRLTTQQNMICRLSPAGERAQIPCQGMIYCHLLAFVRVSTAPGIHQMPPIIYDTLYMKVFLFYRLKTPCGPTRINYLFSAGPGPTWPGPAWPFAQGKMNRILPKPGPGLACPGPPSIVFIFYR